MKPAFSKVVVITRKTALDEMIQRFNTRDQARFYIEHMGGDFSEYEAAHEAHAISQKLLRDAIPRGVRSQWIDREFLPNFTFDPAALAITLGPDGLVVNAAKYLDDVPLFAFNPDPSRIDGVLVPFWAARAGEVLPRAIDGRYPKRAITMARAILNDGRSILGVNDLFLGQKSHVSARYVLEQGERSETQSSSGIIVSTGAGSTGWNRAVVAGASGILANHLGEDRFIEAREDYRFDAEADRLVFTVREPFASRTSGDGFVRGEIVPGRPIRVTSNMPRNGVIFGDGVEEDFLEFNSGAVATVSVADRRLLLLHYPYRGSR